MLKRILTEEVTYKSKLSPNEILKRLHGCSSYKFCSGGFRTNSFAIMRVINYRKTVLPTIKGNISESPEGVTIDVKIGLNSTLVGVFL